jgi:sulfoxide reductase catalytic subunit YedY
LYGRVKKPRPTVGVSSKVFCCPALQQDSRTAEIMQKRRQFLRIAFGFLTGLGLLLSPLFGAFRPAYGKAKKIILPKDTNRVELIEKDPIELDTRNLETTPLKDFDTMGVTDHEVDLNQWRLEVTGRVKAPLSLTNEEILELPSIEKNVLLICPGFFANHGKWKGFSLGNLIEKAKIEKGTTLVKVLGPEEGGSEKIEEFPVEDVLSDRVFLAYNVNGQNLPKKHGFPLRVVAEGYYGSYWVKYAYKVNVV